METTWQKMRRRIREALEDHLDARADRRAHAQHAAWVREGRRIARDKAAGKRKGKAVAQGVQAFELEQEQADKALDARKARRAEAATLRENNRRFWQQERDREETERREARASTLAAVCPACIREDAAQSQYAAVREHANAQAAR